MSKNSNISSDNGNKCEITDCNFIVSDYFLTYAKEQFNIAYEFLVEEISKSSDQSE